jgi:hypothetical protein
MRYIMYIFDPLQSDYLVRHTVQRVSFVRVILDQERCAVCTLCGSGAI